MAVRMGLVLILMSFAAAAVNGESRKENQQIPLTISPKEMSYKEAVGYCAEHNLKIAQSLQKKDNSVLKKGIWVCARKCGTEQSVGAVVKPNGKLMEAKEGAQHFAACIAKSSGKLTAAKPAAKLLRRKKRFIFGWGRRKRHHRRRHHPRRHHPRRHHRRPFFRRPRNGDCTCTMSGDPHYRTFDGTRYNFQSICRYILARSHSRPGCRFSIEAQNAARGRNRRVSYLHYVVVKIFGQEFRMMRGRRMRANGRYVRHYRRSNVEMRIVHRRMVFTSARCGVRILYDGNMWAAVYISRRFYSRHVSGVCGDCDGNGHNDWRTRTGRRINRRGGLYNAEAIGRSWAVPSDDGRVCLRRRPPPPQPACSRQRSRFAASKCSILMQHQVVFKICIARGILHKNFQAMYSECVMDVCALGHSSHLARKITCQSAKLMADRCRAGGVPIRNWRQTYNCPAPKPPAPQNVCDLPPRRGPCRGSHTRFYFNKQTGTCRTFSYGGCGGNPNRFDKYTDCLTECGGKVKPKPTDCSSNEISAILLQKMRIMIQQLTITSHTHMSSLVNIMTMMQQTTTQFQVMMKLFMQMYQMKTQQDMLTKYINLRQSIAQIMGIIKQGINKRYDFEDNIFIKQNTDVILRIISKYKLIKKVYTGQEKTHVFIRSFDKMKNNDSDAMFKILMQIMQNNKGGMGSKKMEAIRVLMPTMMMSGLEELSNSAFKKNNKQLVDLTDLQLKRIQMLNTVVQQKVKVKEHTFIEV